MVVANHVRLDVNAATAKVLFARPTTTRQQLVTLIANRVNILNSEHLFVLCRRMIAVQIMYWKGNASKSVQWGRLEIQQRNVAKLATVSRSSTLDLERQSAQRQRCALLGNTLGRCRLQHPICRVPPVLKVNTETTKTIGRRRAKR